jgi:3-oxoacyl-[acyl-carrier protein] reductase
MSLVNALDFSGKRVLVCGGSDGIGYGVATAFFEAGATVSITGTRSANSYDNDFSNFTYHQLNVQDEITITELANQFDALDVLTNCVGAVLWKKAEFERSGFEKILSINLSGAMQLCTDFYPLLAQSKGSIINIDSVASINAAVNNPAYSASKAGLVQLTKVLAKKWGHAGVRVNTVAPGMIPTKMTVNQSGPDQAAQFSKTNPIPRFGRPQDIAGGVLFLASPLAAYVTGQQLVVDGGLTL